MKNGENMHNKSNIDEILKEGYSYLKKHDFKHALEKYLEGLEENPNSIALINNLAQSYALNGDLAESRKYHEKLIEMANDNTLEMLMLKANSQMFLNNTNDAIQTFEKALTKDATYTPALFELSDIYTKKCKFEKSNRYLDRIIDIDKNNVIALIHKANNLFSMKDYENALDCCNMALKISPKHEDAIMLKGEILEFLGNEDELKTHINETLKIKPDSAYTLMLKAMEYANEDKSKKALEFFNQAIAIDPYLDTAYFNKASYLMHLKRYDEAIESYRQAFEINPESGGIIDKESLFDLLNHMKKAVGKNE